MYAKTIVLGRIGRDPEVRHTRSGDAVLSFSVADTETWKDKTSGEKKESTTWYTCELWGKRAESLSRYLNKGDLVQVEGRMKDASYEKDGVKHYAMKLRVNEVTLMPKAINGGDKPKDTRRPPPRDQGKRPPPPPDDDFDDDDVPF